MNYLETATGLKIVLNTDPDADGITQLLQSIFKIYVDFVLKNPFVNILQKIDSEMFYSRLDDLVKSHHCYT